MREAKSQEALKAAETDAAAESAAPAETVDAKRREAMALLAENQTEAAMDELLAVFKRDRAWEDQKARKELLTLFEAIGLADPLVLAARRKLSALLFS